jgi:acyl carrier protein
MSKVSLPKRSNDTSGPWENTSLSSSPGDRSLVAAETEYALRIAPWTTEERNDSGSGNPCKSLGGERKIFTSTILASVKDPEPALDLSETMFLQLVGKVCSLTLNDFDRLADSGSPLELRVTRLHLDSLALLELQLELEDYLGSEVNLRKVVLTPETSLKDLFLALKI